MGILEAPVCMTAEGPRGGVPGGDGGCVWVGDGVEIESTMIRNRLTVSPGSEGMGSGRQGTTKEFV